MRLSDGARLQGVRYQTAWKWAHEGDMPVLTSFCARLYGRLAARDRAEKALAAAAGGDS